MPSASVGAASDHAPQNHGGAGVDSVASCRTKGISDFSRHPGEGRDPV